MIKTFADKETQRLYGTGQSRRLPANLLRRATRFVDGDAYDVEIVDYH
jgi:plasmid maintenance system killer protein